ncbi:MAG: class I SAM-dependent methyltransferase [Bacilli bacterium]|nr:class I SAM-dependent methyltransferase [Bacilli bacterium]
MEHYFTNDSKSKSEVKEKTVIINDKTLKFLTDNGVFSKKGLDFGTRTLLENLPVMAIKGNVLDFGCGYGPIGIYLKKITNANIDMVDINHRSLSLARKNAVLNKTDVNIFESDIYSSVTNKYNYIISNPPIRVGKDILYEILLGAKDHLKSNGELWIVINKDQGAKTVVQKLSSEYIVEVITKNKGFYVIKAKNK